MSNKRDSEGWQGFVQTAKGSLKDLKMSSLPVSTRLCCPGSFGLFVQPPKQETLRILSPMRALLTVLCQKAKMAPLPGEGGCIPLLHPPPGRLRSERVGRAREGERGLPGANRPTESWGPLTRPIRVHRASSYMSTRA